MEHGDGFAFGLVPDLDRFRRRTKLNGAAFSLKQWSASSESFTFPSWPLPIINRSAPSSKMCSVSANQAAKMLRLGFLHNTKPL